jgi:hypothetical protein
MRKSKLFKGTWLDRSGETYNIHFDKKAHGLRINVHLWHDTNLFEAKLIEGDGRKLDFCEFMHIDNIQPNELQTALDTLQEQAEMRIYYGN